MQVKFLLILLSIPFFLISGCKDNVKTEINNSFKNNVNKFVPSSTLMKEQGENYNSFLYDFCSDSVLQLSRIIFPLQIESPLSKSFIEKSNWKHDFVFLNLNAITDIRYSKYFPNNPDTQIFSWINTNTLKSRNYYFCKNNSQWYLYKIGYNDESLQLEHENFFLFIGKFSKDSVFQKQRIEFPLKYEYLTEEMNDTSEIIFENKWNYSSIYNMCDSISNSNLVFGKPFGNLFDKISKPDTVQFQIIGVENGISVTYIFVLKENQWFLVTLQDFSD